MNLVIFRASFDVNFAHDGCKDLFDFSQEFGIDGDLGPLGPLADAVGICGSGDAGGDVGIQNGELHGELRDVDAIFVADC